MKYIRLSLATVAVAFTSQLAAADTLADAFKNGSLSGEIKAFYFNKDNGTNTEDIFAAGLMLRYLTDEFKGFKAGATFQSSSTPFIDEGGKTMFRNDMWAQGAQLSEAYLSYTLEKTTAKYGRMFMSTPLIAGSGSRLIRESFEGAHLTNTDLPNTTLGAVYVDKFQARTDRNGDVGKFKDHKEGAYSLYAINKSIPNLTLIGAWAHVDKQTAQSDLNIYYAEAMYADKLNEVGYTLAGQYWANKYTSSTDESIYAYAFKAGANAHGLSGYVAYSKVSNDAAPGGYLVHGVGNGSDTMYTYSLIGSYNYEPNMEAYALSLDYALTTAAKVGTLYVQTDTDSEKVSYTGFYASYGFGGFLKGLSVSGQYETIGKDKDGDQFRFRGTYRF